MSTRRLAMLAATAVPAVGVAQSATERAAAGPHVGIIAGVNSSTFGGDVTNAERRTGAVGGLYATLPLGSPLVSVRPEVLFSQKGAEYGNDILHAAVRLNYIAVPVLLQVAVPVGGGVRPRLYAGPSVAFRVGCRLKVTALNSRTWANSVGYPSGQYSTYNTGCSSPENDFDLGYKTLDVGGVAGGQLDFPLGGRTVGVGARYTRGFNNISRYDTLRNRVLSVYGSVEMPFGRSAGHRGS